MVIYKKNTGSNKKQLIFYYKQIRKKIQPSCSYIVYLLGEKGLNYNELKNIHVEFSEYQDKRHGEIYVEFF